MAKWTQSHVRCYCSVDTLTSSYTPTTSVTPCGGAEASATRKRAKYAEIIQSHLYVPIASGTPGPVNMDGQRFLDSLGELLSSVSSEPRETTFLYQRLSVLIQILNSVAFCGTLISETVTEGQLQNQFLTLFLTLWIFTTEGAKI